MELSNDLVIELALNVIGYLAAGGLTLVLYSLIQRRQGVVPRSDSGESGVVSAGGRNVDGSCGPTHGMEIIMFDDRTPASAEPNRPDQAITSPGRQPAGARRDRAEVMRLARKMIQAGASVQRVRSVLPLSEAELALLACQTK